jgi:hypothetical protein
MPRKAPAKKSQPTASKKEASNVKASSKNRPAKPKRRAPASKSKSSGNSIDALVKKQLTSLRQAHTLFKDAVSIVEIYRKKHPELDQYIPSVESTQREIKVRGASSEDLNSHYRFHIEVVDEDPRYGGGARSRKTKLSGPFGVAKAVPPAPSQNYRYDHC